MNREQASSAADDREGTQRGVGGIAMIFGRSFFPIIALVIILGTLLWGPWVSFALAAITWIVALSLV